MLALVLLLANNVLVAQEPPMLNRCQDMAVSPNPATATQSLTLSMTCSCFAPLLNTRTIKIDADQVRLEYSASTICVPIFPPQFIEIPLGSFPPGDYTLIHAPRDEFGNALPTDEILFGVSAIAVPAISPLMLVFLGLGVLLTGLLMRRRNPSVRA